MSRELIVVPNEDFITSGVWSCKLDSDDRHGKGIYDFCLQNKINLDFEKVGDTQYTYNGYIWGVALARLGHASLHVDDYMIACIPDEITIGQYEFFVKYRKYIERFSNKFSFCFINSDLGKVSNLDIRYNDLSVSRVKLFYKELENRYGVIKNNKKELSK